MKLPDKVIGENIEWIETQQFFRVSELPDYPVPNSFYMVQVSKRPVKVDLYDVDRNGVVAKIRSDVYDGVDKADSDIALSANQGRLLYALIQQNGRDIIYQGELIKNIQIGSSNYVHDQFETSDFWIITHNLKKKPSVTVVDTAETVVEGSVEYISEDNLTIKFNFPFSGKAYLN